MEPNVPPQNPRRVVRISRRHLAIVVIIIVIAGIVWAFSNSNFNKNRYVDYSGVAEDMPTVGTQPAPSPDYYPNYYYGQSDITDTREFLKTSYSGDIRTRDVRGATRIAKGAIREVSGRIDNESISEKNAYLSFVVPKTRFEEFRSEIETITFAKLYVENISSQNLLSQKQSLEQQMQSATGTLAKAQQLKADLDATHAKTISSINKDVAAVRSQLTLVRQSMLAAQDQAELNTLAEEEARLVQREAILLQNLATENRSYSNQSQSYLAQIENAQKYIEAVEKQDTQFLNNLDTVNGSISIRWINLWDMAVEISPAHPILVLIIVAIIALYFLNRRGYIPKIELV